MAKYNVPDGHWDRDDDNDESEYSPTTIDTHRVAVILTTDPHEKMGYGRKKYTAHLTHDEDGPTVLYFTRSRWKGNFWREIEELDWLDVPGVVRQQVASVVACDGVDELSPGVRLIEEGGESVWGRDGTSDKSSSQE